MKRIGISFLGPVWTAVLLLLVGLGNPDAVQSPVKVACVGDSITYGAGTTNRTVYAYPEQLQWMLGPGWEIRNFGSSGSTLIDLGDKPYQKQATFQQALDYQPDVVVIMLGTNDTKSQNWAHKDRFVLDYESLVDRFRLLDSNPTIFLCLPPYVAGQGNYGINEHALQEQIAMIEALAGKEGAEVIDIHAKTAGRDMLFSDRVHPNNHGATVLAKTIYQALTGNEYTNSVPDFYETSWRGYPMIKFDLAGHTCQLVKPDKPLPGNPWIWRARFFGAFPTVDLALLKAGYHVAYVDVSNTYGADDGLDVMDLFYAYMVTFYDLNPKPVPEGFSRGGLLALNWARRHPERVSCIYLDAPVCDFKSWPGGKGSGDGSDWDWKNCLNAYGLTEQEAMAYNGNPIDDLEPLARAGIAIIAVYGEADTTVPPDENILELAKRYKQMKGRIQLIGKPGGAHHPHSLSDPTPVVDFILRNQPL
ncbi:MAG: GDSL-type esterase/lipase family protein [Verrucomicrobiota bacterium JB024]|nr:GDSL-type esterase/lipase family protein [Verrucomicrobiota bacterium JB024]